MFGRPKKLKRIDGSTLAYIQIEGEAVKDSNDKQMIVAYAYKKLEFIDWYIEILQSGSKKYIVPHSIEYLKDVRSQLTDIIKKIMNKPISDSGSGVKVSVDVPKGWEG